jgi:hypothetical protein
MPRPPPRVSNLQHRTITLLCFYFTLTLNILAQEVFVIPALRPHSYILVGAVIGMPVGVLAVKAHGWATSEEGLEPLINLLLGSSGILAFLIRSYVWKVEWLSTSGAVDMCP